MLFEAFAVSTGAVALGEIGDKTQLLALVLAARYRRPWPIVAGIFVATLANHAAAAALGAWLQQLRHAGALRWLLGGSFLAVALWMLLPDASARAAALAAYGGVSAATLARARGWAVAMGVVLVEAGLKDDPGLAALGERTLKALREGP